MSNCKIILYGAHCPVYDALLQTTSLENQHLYSHKRGNNKVSEAAARVLRAL